MGCCSSAPVAPTIIIPDPGGTEVCTFALKKAGMFSSDYIAYKGDSTDDEEKKWLFVNKTGSFWSGNAIVELENFKRGGDKENRNKGEILWKASFNGSPQFQKHYKTPTSGFTRFLSGFGINLTDSEPDDRKYFQGWGMNDGGYQRIMKWMMATSATIRPVTRAQVAAPSDSPESIQNAKSGIAPVSDPKGLLDALHAEYVQAVPAAVGKYIESVPATDHPIIEQIENEVRASNAEEVIQRYRNEWGVDGGCTAGTLLPASPKGMPGVLKLNVFARGTSACDYDREEKRDPETGKFECYVYTHKVQEYVDELQFQLELDGQALCCWAVPGDFDMGDAAVEQSNQLFNMQMNGGWFSSKPVIDTKAGWDPTLGLLIGYLCAFEYSPSEIKSDLKSHFPKEPFGDQWHGW